MTVQPLALSVSHKSPCQELLFDCNQVIEGRILDMVGWYVILPLVFALHLAVWFYWIELFVLPRGRWVTIGFSRLDLSLIHFLKVQPNWSTLAELVIFRGLWPPANTRRSLHESPDTPNLATYGRSSRSSLLSQLSSLSWTWMPDLCRAQSVSLAGVRSLTIPWADRLSVPAQTRIYVLRPANKGQRRWAYKDIADGERAECICRSADSCVWTY